MRLCPCVDEFGLLGLGMGLGLTRFKFKTVASPLVFGRSWEWEFFELELFELLYLLLAVLAVVDGVVLVVVLVLPVVFDLVVGIWDEYRIPDADTGLLDKTCPISPILPVFPPMLPIVPMFLSDVMGLLGDW